jgi:hypothetical protein
MNDPAGAGLVALRRDAEVEVAVEVTHELHACTPCTGEENRLV